MVIRVGGRSPLQAPTAHPCGRPAPSPANRLLGVLPLTDASYFRLRGWIPMPLYVMAVVRLDGAPPTFLELVLGAGLVVAGLALRAGARAYMGRSSDTRHLHAKRLVTEGPYAWTRNPIYAGNWLIAVGLTTLMRADAYVLVLGLLLFLHYLRVIVAEEHMLQRTFGARYDEYCRSVPRLVPRMSVRRLIEKLMPLKRELRIVALACLVMLLTLAIRYQ